MRPRKCFTLPSKNKIIHLLHKISNERVNFTPPPSSMVSRLLYDVYAQDWQILRGRGRKIVIFASFVSLFPSFFYLSQLPSSQTQQQCILFHNNTSRDLYSVLNYNIKLNERSFWSKMSQNKVLEKTLPLKQQTKEVGP